MTRCRGLGLECLFMRNTTYNNHQLHVICKPIFIIIINYISEPGGKERGFESFFLREQLGSLRGRGEEPEGTGEGRQLETHRFQLVFNAADFEM